MYHRTEKNKVIDKTMDKKREHFKSLCFPIKDCSSLEPLLNMVNNEWSNIKKITFPDEYKHWKGEELYNFYIEPYSVDRVYFCESAWIILSEFRMLLKIQYKSRPLYVELLYAEDENEIKVMILTYRIQRFIDSIVSDYGERENILKFMLDDDSNIQRSWDTDSSLKHLCCKTIYSYRYKCWGAFIDKIIPRLMWNKINDNIEMQKIKDTYERKICMISMVKKQPDLYPW